MNVLQAQHAKKFFGTKKILDDVNFTVDMCGSRIRNARTNFQRTTTNLHAGINRSDIMNVLQVQHVKKFFGSKLVLDDINFTVNAGECLGIVGLSGGGKSTLARIIARLIDCDGGQIFLCGEDITHAAGNAFYRNMQMIFQTPEDSFAPRRTLGASIAEPIRNFLNVDNLRGHVENLLTEVGLPAEYSKRYPREVSGGECQRAAIARAISIAPKLLICDEATSALDVTIQAQIVALIKNLCVKKNIACLFITHDLTLIKKLADRVLELRDGKLSEVSNDFNATN